MSDEHSFATDRLGLLVDQFDTSIDLALDRLTGLDDAEYLWEPVAGMWSVRPRGRAASRDPFGRGDFVLDWSRGVAEPAPMTTIAWRIGHVIEDLESRHEYTFGARGADLLAFTAFDGTADAALAHLRRAADAWHTAVLTLTDEQLDVPGYGQYPYGLDPQLPFGAILWWVNREVIHHLAECALLRDLYTHRTAAR